MGQMSANLHFLLTTKACCLFYASHEISVFLEIENSKMTYYKNHYIYVRSLKEARSYRLSTYVNNGHSGPSDGIFNKNNTTLF